MCMYLAQPQIYKIKIDRAKEIENHNESSQQRKHRDKINNYIEMIYLIIYIYIYIIIYLIL